MRRTRTPSPTRSCPRRPHPLVSVVEMVVDRDLARRSRPQALRERACPRQIPSIEDDSDVVLRQRSAVVDDEASARDDVAVASLRRVGVEHDALDAERGPASSPGRQEPAIAVRALVPGQEQGLRRREHLDGGALRVGRGRRLELDHREGRSSRSTRIMNDGQGSAPRRSPFRCRAADRDATEAAGDTHGGGGDGFSPARGARTRPATKTSVTRASGSRSSAASRGRVAPGRTWRTMSAAAPTRGVPSPRATGATPPRPPSRGAMPPRPRCREASGRRAAPRGPCPAPCCSQGVSVPSRTLTPASR